MKALLVLFLSGLKWGKLAASGGSMLLIVAVLAAPQLVQAWRYDPHAPENVAYYGVPLQIKLEYGAGYLGLAALLAIMTFDVHEMLGRFARPV